MFRFGTFELDPAVPELRKAGVKLRLTGRPMDVLLYLTSRAGEVVTREELRARLWSDGTHVDFDHGLDNALNKLRQTLGDSSASPRFIETIPRRGYRFIADVQRPETPPRHRPIAPIVLGIVLLVTTGGLMLRQQRSSSRAAAHEAYVNGRQALAGDGADAIARATAYFRKAIELDRDTAPSHAALAMALNRRGILGLGDPATAYTEARDAAERALRLDPELAEAYVARATAKLRRDWDWRGAENDLRRAIELDPNFVRPHQAYAQLLAARGRWNEALREIGGARQLDPLSLEVRGDEGTILYLARRYDAAVAQLTQAVAAAPRDAEARAMLANAHLHAGNSDAAALEYVTWLALVGVPEDELAVVRSTLAAEGFAGQWRRLAAQTTKPGHHYKRAAICAALDAKQDALAALEQAFAQKESALLQLAVDPALDPLRGEARFTALLRRAKLDDATTRPAS